MNIAALILQLVHDVLAVLRETSVDSAAQRQAVQAALTAAQASLSDWDAQMDALQSKLNSAVPHK